MSDTGKLVRVLSLQPFYGGSHRQFINQWMARSRHDWCQETLPDRHWKWRMRHAAIEFAQRADRLWNSGQRFDLIFVTDMLNVAEFRGLLRSDISRVPILLYFHENQFAYPNVDPHPRDFHFAFTNLTSAISADFVWFNSRFNRDSMLENLTSMMNIWPDYQPRNSIDLIRGKSEIQYPGICEGTVEHITESSTTVLDSSRIDHCARFGNAVHLVWASRWEHDKNPCLLLNILQNLREREFNFRLSVVGQRYKNSPVEFDQIHRQFGNQIANWGYLESRKDFISVLQEADLFLSTADHEFFGIAAAEAVAAGCMPMFPNRLAYPELLGVDRFPDRQKFLYTDSNDAAEKIIGLVEPLGQKHIGSELSRDFVQRFGWRNRVSDMDNRIEALVRIIDNGFGKKTEGKGK